MVFFKNLTNVQSAAAWVLCGVLAYVYSDLQKKEQIEIIKKNENDIGLYHGLKRNIKRDENSILNIVGPKRKEN
jgi:hypothetical protein